MLIFLRCCGKGYRLCMRIFKRKLLAIGWFLFVAAFFNFFAYPVDSFNAAVRNFVKTGKFDVRTFDDNGFPISSSPRLGSFVSPFYIVHYGILYSRGMGRDGLHWRDDPSLDYWNVEPPVISEHTQLRYFKNSADWVLDHVVMFNGKAHLLYDFDWPYPNYPNGKLTAPWWSGLTDGYALILLLRAYDYFGDKKYLEVAGTLYESVLTPVAEGGSTVDRNGCPWIEEYVDPEAAPADMSFVFNGMVYGAHAVEAYERFIGLSKPHSSDLFKCVERNIAGYDLGGWSYYDAIGNSSNIKYHHISYILFADLINSGRVAHNKKTDRILKSWSVGFHNPGFHYVLSGPRSFGYFHFVGFFVFMLILPFLVILFCRRR